MKITKEALRQVIKEELNETLIAMAGRINENSLPSAGGTTKLYHFSDAFPEGDAETVVLDPINFGKNTYSKRELAASAVPRTFFYVDLTEKEIFFEKTALYTAIVPTSNIYDLTRDPENVKKAVKEKNYGVLDMDQVLRDVSGWAQGEWGSEDQGKWIKKDGMADGMYYETPNFAVVVMFIPMKAKFHGGGYP